jgi:hypothetical protein
MGTTTNSTRRKEKAVLFSWMLDLLEASGETYLDKNFYDKYIPEEKQIVYVTKLGAKEILNKAKKARIKFTNENEIDLDYVNYLVFDWYKFKYALNKKKNAPPQITKISEIRVWLEKNYELSITLNKIKPCFEEKKETPPLDLFSIVQEAPNQKRKEILKNIKDLTKELKMDLISTGLPASLAMAAAIREVGKQNNIDLEHIASPYERLISNTIEFTDKEVEEVYKIKREDFIELCKKEGTLSNGGTPTEKAKDKLRLAVLARVSYIEELVKKHQSLPITTM